MKLVIGIILFVGGFLLSLAALFMAFLLMTPQGSSPIKATDVQAIALVAFAVSATGLTVSGALLLTYRPTRPVTS
jgi:hypothetical protein